MLALLDALWPALSFGSHESVLYSNLSWRIGGTAILCIFLAGAISGVSSGARGLGAGSASGLTTWGLVVIAVGAVVLPTFAIGHIPNTVRAWVASVFRLQANGAGRCPWVMARAPKPCAMLKHRGR